MIGIWIRSSRGQVVLVDPIDQDLANYKWYDGRKGELLAFPRGYQRKPRTTNYLSLHRVICERTHGPAPEKIADHINRDRSDSRRHNLRWATIVESNWNRRGATQSGYKGVYLQPQCRLKRFRAVIEPEGRKISLGGFETAEEAARAYDAAARQYGGTFAYLNFPTESA